MIASERLQKLTGFGRYDEFTTAHRNWVEAILESGVYVRKGKWTQKVSYPVNLDVENDDIDADPITTPSSRKKPALVLIFQS